MDNDENPTVIQEFITRLNTLPHAVNMDPTKTLRLAKIFLRARKFDLIRAFELYNSYRHMRYTQQLEDINPLDEGVRRELLSGKFTVLPHSSNSTGTVIIFSVRHHWPPMSTDRDVLKGILYQLDAALLDEQTQKQGIIVIYDMTAAKYSNFSADLSMKLLNLLTGNYPARLRNILIIDAPLWFRPPYLISRLFVKEKIRERIISIYAQDLNQYIPSQSIPTSLGGCFPHKHIDWLKVCFDRMLFSTAQLPTDYFTFTSKGFNKEFNHLVSNDQPNNGRSSPSLLMTSSMHDTTCDNLSRCMNHPINRTMTLSRLSRAENGITLASQLSGTNRSYSLACRQQSNLMNEHKYCSRTQVKQRFNSSSFKNVNKDQYANGIDSKALTKLKTLPLGTCNNANQIDTEMFISESGITDNYLATDPNSPYRMEVSKYLKMFENNKLSKFEKEFDDFFKKTQICGTTDRFKDRLNWSKNRYLDVPCLDQSRVVLPNDAYIHANYVHGYSQPNAYILTQGPLDSSISDFWKMVWTSKANIIVMLTKTVENNRSKCSQYWPARQPSTNVSSISTARIPLKMESSPFLIENLEETFESNGLYRLTKLQLSRIKFAEEDSGDCEVHFVDHFLFLGWPDFDVPLDANDFLIFLDAINKAALNRNEGQPTPLPPLIIHCSAGIGRTGTLTAIDICLAQAKSEGCVDVRGVLSRIRCQRTCAVQMNKQYAFIYSTLYSRLSSKA